MTRTTLSLLLAIICGAVAAEEASQSKSPDRAVAATSLPTKQDASKTGALVLAESDQNLVWCKGEGGPSPDQQIISCTSLIESGSYRGRDLARTYFRRAMGYLRKQDLDSAIEDFDAGLALDPDTAAALYNRAVDTKPRAIQTAR
jgi:tetratricopeptide (TPR) repeat protein